MNYYNLVRIIKCKFT